MQHLFRRGFIAVIFVPLLLSTTARGAITLEYSKAQSHNTVWMYVNISAERIYKDILDTIIPQPDVTLIKRDDTYYHLGIIKNFQMVNFTVTPCKDDSSQVVATSNAGIDTYDITDEALITMKELCYSLGIFFYVVKK